MAYIEHETNGIDRRFREVYLALATERTSWDESIWLRFAAFSVILRSGPPAVIARAIRNRGELLRSQAPWFGILSSPMRFMVAAVLLQANIGVKQFNDTLQHIRSSFDHLGLRHRDSYDVLSAVIIHLLNQGRPLSALQMERIRDIYHHMKKVHWWLTGPDDLPAAVLLSFRSQSAGMIVEDAESIYQQLTFFRYLPGDALQTTAHLLVFVGKYEHAARRYDAIAQACTANDLSLTSSDYEALVMLTLLDHSPEDVAHRCRSYHESLLELKPALYGSAEFALSCDLTFLDLVRTGRDNLPLADLTDGVKIFESLKLFQVMNMIVAMDTVYHSSTSETPLDAWPYSGIY